MAGYDPRPRTGGTAVATLVACLVAGTAVAAVSSVALTAGFLGAAVALGAAFRLTGSETRLATLVGSLLAPTGTVAAVGLAGYWLSLGFQPEGALMPLRLLKRLVLPSLGLGLVVLALARQLSFLADDEGGSFGSVGWSLFVQSVGIVGVALAVGWIAFLPPGVQSQFTAVFETWAHLVELRAEPNVATTLLPALLFASALGGHVLLVRVESLDLRRSPRERTGRDPVRLVTVLTGLAAIAALMVMFVRLGSPQTGIPFLVGPPVVYDALAGLVIAETCLVAATYVLAVVRRTQSTWLVDIGTEQSGTAAIAALLLLAPFPPRVATAAETVVTSVPPIPNVLAFRFVLVVLAGAALFSLAVGLRTLLSTVDMFTRSDGHTARVRGTAAMLYLGVVLVAFRHDVAVLALVGGVGSILVWDLQEHAIVLGEQVGRRLTMTRPEGAHFVGSTLVGGVGVGIGYAVVAATDRSVSAAFPAVVLTGVLVSAILLAVLWLPRVRAD
ncbi:DUF7519 family protein [Haloarcula marina]|uniref:DUF7519 family protein n=1 Tax=Haloarcula marina TaxID=2961574 RepID=UPI0020B7399A|nr:hypothetical protein [Halomicroarcula marina]